MKADKTIIMTKVSETVYKITVKGVQVDDAGVYKVVATNDWGTVGSEAKVTVERKPHVHHQRRLSSNKYFPFSYRGSTKNSQRTSRY